MFVLYFIHNETMFVMDWSDYMKLKIVNFKKFICTTIIFFSIIIISIILFSNISFSHEKLQYKEICVLKGDTLWNISREESKNNKFYQGRDIRYIISDIKKTNGINSNDNLQVGQKIKIPYL